MKDRFKQGMVMTICAGIAWGFSGNCAEILFKNFGITPVYLSSMRMVFFWSDPHHCSPTNK